MNQPFQGYYQCTPPTAWACSPFLSTERAASSSFFVAFLSRKAMLALDMRIMSVGIDACRHVKDPSDAQSQIKSFEKEDVDLLFDSALGLDYLSSPCHLRGVRPDW